jgi:AcrR family transcriptional regulator
VTTIHKEKTIRQQQIISAARRLIAKHGSEHVTVRRMAKEIGVTEGSIYRHFKSKRDVLSFLVDDIENTLIGDIEKQASSEYDSLEALKEIIVDHLSGVEQRKGVSFQVIAEIVSLGDKKLNSQISHVINKYNERIKVILSEGVKVGIVRPDIDLYAAATMYFGMTQALVNRWALSQYKFDLLEQFKPVWDIFSKALINPMYQGKEIPVAPNPDGHNERTRTS